MRRQERLSDQVAELLLNEIFERGLRPGDTLPSERELGERYGVSRTVIREAVRALSAKGVINARTGSGLRIAAVEAQAVSESMKLYLLGQAPLDYAKLHEVRTTLELAIVTRAATHATDDGIAYLRQTNGAMTGVLDDVDRAAHQDLAFHRAIAEVSGNELYVVLLDALRDTLLEIRRITFAGDVERLCSVPDAHNTVIDAIATHDPDGAVAAMQWHLEDVSKTWDRVMQDPAPDA